MKTTYMKPAIKIKYIETEGDLLATSNNNFVQTNAGYGGYVGDVDVVLLMELDSESLCDFESALQKSGINIWLCQSQIITLPSENTHLKCKLQSYGRKSRSKRVEIGRASCRERVCVIV